MKPKELKLKNQESFTQQCKCNKLLPPTHSSYAAEKVLFDPRGCCSYIIHTSTFAVSTANLYILQLSACNEEKTYCTDLKQTMNMGIILITVSD